MYAIQKYLLSREDHSEFLFVQNRAPHTSITISSMKKRFRYLGKKAGIDKIVHPHLIRHTTATHALQHGMDITEIQKMLGHSSIATTMIYAAVDDKNVRDSHLKCVI